jgi:KaiC/GvpD/RAD55 family RecA-like ATPase
MAKNLSREEKVFPLEESLPTIRTTGISILDRTLGGGLPSGSLIYLSADPKSSYEVFLYQFTQTQKTYYFTTDRRPAFINRDIKTLGFDTSKITYIDIYSEYYLTPRGEIVDNVGNEFVDAKIIEFTEYNLRKVIEMAEKDINIIIDSFSFYLNLNANPGRIKRLVNITYEITKEINGLTYLYCLKNTHDKKIENEIMKICDIIFDVELEKTPDRLVNKLAIPKIRGRVANTDLIRFKVEEGVQIDTTKELA